ncbi:MAG: DoxX family protein [Candidatus Magasanikbacteria bacterium]|nr:DoxX family protein [Candidatus Magasanikbacteria bacterium]
MLNTKGFCKCADWGLLLIRLGLAAVFLTHGVQKLTHIDGTIAFFAGLGFSSFFAWLVAICETLGGFALLFGVYMQAVGPVLAIVMLVAIFKAKLGRGFVGYEFEFLLLLATLGMGMIGPGRFALCNHCCVCTGKGDKEMKGGCCGGKGDCACK